MVVRGLWYVRRGQLLSSSKRQLASQFSKRRIQFGKKNPWRTLSFLDTNRSINIQQKQKNPDFAAVAQEVEWLSANRKVAGSIPELHLAKCP